MLVETGSTNMILREIKYFQTLEKSSENIMTIVGRDGVIVGSGQDMAWLPGSPWYWDDKKIIDRSTTHDLMV